MNPISEFESWLVEETRQSELALPYACCLSTIGLDGYPNSRFVSLKEVVDESFVITGPTSSRKGKEISSCAKASLAFWWTTTQRQVRIQGDVIKIPDAQADVYFEGRSRDAKIVSSAFKQGKEISGVEELRQLYSTKAAIIDSKIVRPDDWGGWKIRPIRIELMEFQESRLHERKLFQLIGKQWKCSVLQP